MKVVFDENVPWPLRKLLSDYSVTSVQREGLGGTENGELLAALDGDLTSSFCAIRTLDISRTSRADKSRSLNYPRTAGQSSRSDLVGIIEHRAWELRDHSRKIRIRTPKIGLGDSPEPIGCCTGPSCARSAGGLRGAF